MGFSASSFCDFFFFWTEAKNHLLALSGWKQNCQSFQWEASLSVTSLCLLKYHSGWEATAWFAVCPICHPRTGALPACKQWIHRPAEQEQNMLLIVGRGEDKSCIKKDKGVNIWINWDGLVREVKQMKPMYTVRWQWDPLLARCDI